MLKSGRGEPERVLYLAILAQAVYDVLQDTEDSESAWLFLSGHGKLLERIRRLSPKAKELWLKDLERVLEE